MKRPNHTNSKYVSQALSAAFFLFIGALVLFPAVYTLCNSFMSPAEISHYYAAAMRQDEHAAAAFHLSTISKKNVPFLKGSGYLAKANPPQRADENLPR